MQSKATTVDEYVASLPPDRRAAIEAVRKAINDNLDPTYREGMSYGMIGWCVPHSVFPDGYHCNPAQPLPFAGLASQKGHMSLYLMGLYIVDGGAGGESELGKWFRAAWTKTGRKLDMGKACIRFKKIEDVALDVVGEAFRRLPAKQYIATYVTLRDTPRSGTAGASGGAKTKVSAKGAASVKSAASAKAPAKAKAKAQVKKAATRAKPSSTGSKKSATKSAKPR